MRLDYQYVHEEVFKEMDKLVSFCREVATFDLTVALIWDGTLTIRIGFTSFVIGVTVISLKTVHLKTD